MLDLATLKTFITVVEEGSFSRASQRLLRTQPAVSLAVKRLEEELGERLLDRSSRELLLTDAGQLVLSFGKRFENLDRELKRALEELRNLSAGQLRVGANESTTLYLLHHLQEFRRLYPRIKVRVQRCLSSQIPQQLLSGEIEMGVISYDPGDQRLIARVIFIDHLSFIVSPQHPLAGRKEVSIQDLGNEIFIAHNVVSPYRRVVLDSFQRHRVTLKQEVEMPTIETIRRLVQENEGVAFLPRMVVDQEVNNGTLCEIRVPELRVERRIRLVYPRQRTLSRASRAFLKLLDPEGGGEKRPTVAGTSPSR